MKTLQKLVEQENRMAAIFKSPMLSLDSKEDRQKIAESISCSLSPENLTCDGELSRSKVQQKYNFLKKAQAELLKLDPTVKFYE